MAALLQGQLQRSHQGFYPRGEAVRNGLRADQPSECQPQTSFRSPMRSTAGCHAFVAISPGWHPQTRFWGTLVFRGRPESACEHLLPRSSRRARSLPASGGEKKRPATEQRPQHKTQPYMSLPLFFLHQSCVVFLRVLRVPAQLPAGKLRGDRGPSTAYDLLIPSPPARK